MVVIDMSRYQVMLSNVPEYGTLHGLDDIQNEKIDSMIIYDTLEDHCGKNNVIQVIQISNDKYLAHFSNINIAKNACNILNNTLINNNVINVTIIDEFEHISNTDSYKQKIYNFTSRLISKIQTTLSRICNKIYTNIKSLFTRK